MRYSIILIGTVPDTAAASGPYLRITWTDSTDPNAVSNNIYRSLVSGGPYVKIANVLDGIELYNDYTVTPGIQYFYVLTEVNNAGAESAFSAQQSGIAP